MEFNKNWIDAVNYRTSRRAYINKQLETKDISKNKNESNKKESAKKKTTPKKDRKINISQVNIFTDKVIII